MRQIIKLNVPESIKNAVKDEQFRVFYNATAKDVEIFLTGEVGDEYTQSDSASIAKLLSMNRGKAVTMRVNSGGGLAFDGLAIYNALTAHDAPTTGIVEGLAASAASLAVIGCDTVKMYANASYHIHEGMAFAFGHIADLRDSIEWLEQFNAAAVDTYAAKCGKPHEYIAAALLGEGGDGTKYTAEQAKEIGFIDEVLPIGGKKSKAQNEDRKRLQSMLNFRIAKHRLTELR